MIKLNTSEHKIWFTSDLHFGHNKEFLYKPRGFNSIEEHDETIINNFNSVVSNDDEVFILGDLMLVNNDNGIECLKKLNGKKYILGTDGLCYEYEEIQKLQGTQVVGTTIAGKTGVTTNTGLSTAVSDMTIGDLRTSFGTYVSPALDKAKKYIVKDKTNVVIVLSDGAFNDNNYSSKANSLNSFRVGKSCSKFTIF